MLFVAGLCARLFGAQRQAGVALVGAAVVHCQRTICLAYQAATCAASGRQSGMVGAGVQLAQVGPAHQSAHGGLAVGCGVDIGIVVRVAQLADHAARYLSQQAAGVDELAVVCGAEAAIVGTVAEADHSLCIAH